MDFQWIAIALGDVVWIAIAFALGLLSRSAGLPPLVGFLAAGFLLNAFGMTSGETLERLSDLGITLLLFTVGLKLDLRTLTKPHVWAVTGLHSSIVIVAFGLIIHALALLGVSLFSDLDLPGVVLIAFALSFSSTVFVVKVLEERGEMASLHGRISVGILIMQDVAAVAFLAVATASWPSVWAFLVVLLFPLRGVLHQLLQRVGHGELLVLYGFLLAVGGAELFELVKLKGSLGALVLGLLISNHPKADEMAKTMLGFKDLFLLGFFLSVGMSADLTLEIITVGALITPLVFFKSALFVKLLTRFRLRARTAVLASLELMNFSEFGLIVAAVGVASGWIDSQWLVVIAVALSLSFAIAAGFNAFSHGIYWRYQTFWKSLQRKDLALDDQLLDTRGARTAVIGMGGIGTRAFDVVRERYGETVVGVDIDPVTVENHRSAGRNVLRGDPGDADFWDRMQETHTLQLVMLALPRLSTALDVLEQLKTAGFTGEIAAMAKFEDEEEALKQAGATTVFNVYSEAGAGFAAHVMGPD